MDCSRPGSSVHGIFQARVLEWGTVAFSQNGLLGPTYSPKSLSHLTAHKTLSTLAVIQVHFTSPVPVPATGFLHLLLPQPRTVFIPLLVLFFRSQAQSCQPSLNPVTKSNRSLGSPVLWSSLSLLQLYICTCGHSAPICLPDYTVSSTGAGFYLGPAACHLARDANLVSTIPTNEWKSLPVLLWPWDCLLRSPHKLQTSVNEPSEDTEIITKGRKEGNHYLLSASFIAKEKKCAQPRCSHLILTATVL